jgi:N-acetylmuramoyl-L-alanine amidase
VENSDWNGLRPVKNHTIGVELENAGELWRQDNTWQSWRKETVPITEIVRLRGDSPSHGWHRFTDIQIHAFFDVVCALRAAYPTIEDIVAHSEIDKVGDPGLIFPLQELRIKLFRSTD